MEKRNDCCGVSPICEAEVRKIDIEHDGDFLTFSHLSTTLENLFNNGERTIKLDAVQYCDKNKDIITIGSDVELQCALTELAQPYKILIKLHDKNPKEFPNFGNEDEYPGVVCTCCQGPIRGYRYKCATCPNFDLCKKCELGGYHPKHDMIRISSIHHMYPPYFFTRLSRLYERVFNPTFNNFSPVPPVVEAMIKEMGYDEHEVTENELMDSFPDPEEMMPTWFNMCKDEDEDEEKPTAKTIEELTKHVKDLTRDANDDEAKNNDSREESQADNEQGATKTRKGAEVTNKIIDSAKEFDESTVKEQQQCIDDAIELLEKIEKEEGQEGDITGHQSTIKPSIVLGCFQKLQEELDKLLAPLSGNAQADLKANDEKILGLLESLKDEQMKQAEVLANMKPTVDDQEAVNNLSSSSSVSSSPFELYEDIIEEEDIKGGKDGEKCDEETKETLEAFSAAQVKMKKIAAAITKDIMQVDKQPLDFPDMGEHSNDNINDLMSLEKLSKLFGSQEESVEQLEKSVPPVGSQSNGQTLSQKEPVMDGKDVLVDLERRLQEQIRTVLSEEEPQSTEEFKSPSPLPTDLAFIEDTSRMVERAAKKSSTKDAINKNQPEIAVATTVKNTSLPETVDSTHISKDSQRKADETNLTPSQDLTKDTLKDALVATVKKTPLLQAPDPAEDINSITVVSSDDSSEDTLETPENEPEKQQQEEMTNDEVLEVLRVVDEQDRRDRLAGNTCTSPRRSTSELDSYYLASSRLMLKKQMRQQSIHNNIYNPDLLAAASIARPSYMSPLPDPTEYSRPSSYLSNYGALSRPTSAASFDDDQLSTTSSSSRHLRTGYTSPAYQSTSSYGAAARMCTSPTSPRINDAVDQMISMGFSNDDGLLTDLLTRKHGDIDKVLDILMTDRNG